MIRTYDHTGEVVDTRCESLTPAERHLLTVRSQLRGIELNVRRLEERFERVKKERGDPADIPLWWEQESDLLNLKDKLDALVRETCKAFEAAGVTNAHKYLPPFRERTPEEEHRYHMRED
jgi:hypothetical protein